MATSLVDVICSPPDREIVAGVDTHSDLHHVAVLGITGTRLGNLQAPATSMGYEQLLGYIQSLGSVRLVGNEGTSSYRVGLSR